jgi:UDP-glucose 4-epimerase
MAASRAPRPPGPTIFFPAYNDGGTIGSPVLLAVQAAGRLTPDFELTVVDDGSTDASRDVLDDLARTYPNVRAIHHQQNRGYRAALRTGFAAATKHLIAYTDGDAQYDPAELPVLWNQLTLEADMVTGYEIRRSGPWQCIVIGRMYHHTVRFLFRLRVRDVDCDFRLIRREIIDRVKLEKDTRVIPSPPRPVAVLQLQTDILDRHRRAPVLGEARRPPSRPHELARPVPNDRRRHSARIHKTVTRYREFYRDRPVMITGGLGFIGSNLAHQLVSLGARVLIVDSLIPAYGGNLFNIHGIEDRLRVNIADIRQQSTMNYLVQGHDVIFNLAGQVSHIDSMEEPYTDLEINCRSQLTLLEACRHNNPAVKVVFAGTRQIYGRPESLPVAESHLVRPTDINGINKAAGEYYHLVYNNVFGVRATSLRLTNVYGPRQLIKHSRQGFVGWFIRLALEDKEIQIYGDGTQLRDFVYVDDAVDAFLRAGATDVANREVFNVGGLEPIQHRDLVELMIRIAGAGRFRCTPWPPEKQAIDIGDFYSDSSKICSTLGWQATTKLADGLNRTFEYYRAHFDQYVPTAGEQVASL